MRSPMTLLLGLFAAACAGDPPPEEPAVAEEPVRLTEPPPAPEVLFSGLEDRLLGARTVALDFHIVAEGAVEADLQGQLAVNPDGHAQLSAIGTFAGRGFDVILESEGGVLEYGPIEEPREGAVPPALGEALLIGMTRMGVLHNVARLVGGALPDQASGGVDRWARVSDHTYAAERTVEFAITVAGEPSGTATLEFDEEDLPLVRRQVVLFPEGEMRVEERYSAVSVR